MPAPATCCYYYVLGSRFRRSGSESSSCAAGPTAAVLGALMLLSACCGAPPAQRRLPRTTLFAASTPRAEHGSMFALLVLLPAQGLSLIRSLPYRSCQKRHTGEVRPGVAWAGLGWPGRGRQQPQRQSCRRPLTARSRPLLPAATRARLSRLPPTSATKMSSAAPAPLAEAVRGAVQLSGCWQPAHACLNAALPAEYHPCSRSLPCCVDLRAGGARCAAHHPAPARLLWP